MELTNYLFESGSKVRLFYKDGRQKVVSRTELPQHLTPFDAERVQNAFYMRQTYFKELPKWVKVILVSVLVLGLGYQGVKAAPSIQRVLHNIVPAIPKPAEPASPKLTQSSNNATPGTFPAQLSAEPAQQKPAEVTLPANATENIGSVMEVVAKRLTRRPAGSFRPSAHALVPGPVRQLQDQVHQ